MKHLLGVLALSAVACGGSPAPGGAKSPEPKKAAPAKAAPVAADAFRDKQPPSGAPAEIHYPKVEHARLSSGMSLFVVQRPAGVVTMSVVARGGASRVPAGKSGLAALTLRMMTEGTTTHRALELSEAVESLGTTLEQSAGRDYVRIGLTTLAEDHRRGLELLAEVVQKPAFAASEFERVRKEWLDGIEAERQSPSRLSVLVGLRLLLGKDAGAPVSGSRSDVKALKRADLVQFHRASFTADDTALVVVGNVSLADVSPLAEKLFSSMPRSGGKPPVPPVLPPAPDRERTVLVDRPGAVQSALFVVQPFPKRSEPGYETRELLSALVGGFFTSRLNMNLREEHAFTYGARSLDIATRSWGAFAVVTSVRTDVTAAALDETRKELDQVRDPALGKPLGRAEVDLSRVDRKQDLGTTLSHTAEVAERVEELFVHELPDDYYSKYPALLDAITPEAVALEARRIEPTRAITVVVGDKQGLAAALASRHFEVAAEELTD